MSKVEYKSEAKYLRIGPRKLREVADVVKKQSLPEMLVNLQHIDKKGSNLLLKALKSAIANVENNSSLTLDKLRLKKIAINEGPSFKRWRPVSRGRAHPFKRRTAHIEIVLMDDLNDQDKTKRLKVRKSTTQDAKVETKTRK